MRGMRSPCPAGASRVRRLHIVCSTPAAWGASRRGSSSSKSYPPLSYSVNRRDISGAELAMLLSAARSADMADPGQPLALHNYSYWCSQAGIHHATKLEVALRRSVATVACFTTLDVYGEAEAEALRQQQQQQQQGEGSSGSSGSSSFGAGGSGSSSSRAGLTAGRSGSPLGLGLGRNLAAEDEECPLTHEQHERERAARLGGGGGASNGWPKPPTPRGTPDMEWNWLRPNSSSSTSSSASGSGSGGGGGPFGRPAAASRKQLVGFARATGDNSLVATVYDVAVHPAMRGLGIGHRLVKLLLQQVQARAVYDIGVITPSMVEGFWEHCSFEDDREDSTFMIFTGRCSSGSSSSSSSRNGSSSSRHGSANGYVDGRSGLGVEDGASGRDDGTSEGAWSPPQEERLELGASRHEDWGRGGRGAEEGLNGGLGAASRVQYGSQLWSDGSSSGSDSSDAAAASSWAQQQQGQWQEAGVQQEAVWETDEPQPEREQDHALLDECGCWMPETTEALLERADLGHWEAAAQSASLRRLLDVKLQRIKESGGRPGDGGGSAAAAAAARRGPRWTGLGLGGRSRALMSSPWNGVGNGAGGGNGNGSSW